ncbi:MAG: lipoate--protein ligase family protein, partial [Thermoprotei archaeon]
LRKLRILMYERPDDAYWNIAVEEAIPRAVSLGISPPTLRFFRNENAVIIGVFQYAEKEVNMEYANENQIQVVRRFTGGGAVFHDMGNINYALSLPFNEFHIPKDLVEYYGFFIKPIVLALKEMGIRDVEKGLLNDIEISGKKVGGSAASIKWDVGFFHGTLLVNTDLEKLSNVLKVPKTKLSDKGVSSVKKRVINIAEIKPEISQEEIVDSIIREYSKHLNVEVMEGELSDKEEKIARVLYEVKYSKKEWNIDRGSPLVFDREVEKALIDIGIL